MTNATQIIILGVFIFFLVVAVIVFAAFGGGSQGSASATIEIWGTVPQSLLPRIAEAINTATPGAIKITYQEIAENEFEDTLTKALADGAGPDVVLMPEDLLYQNKKRLSIIGYNVYPERTFKDSFISSAEVLLTPDGSYGLPLLVDPVVMYWNRSLLSSAGIAKAPSSWEDAVALVPKLSVIADDKTISRSAIGLGDFSNVTHGKDIISSLLLQSGSKMVAWDTKDTATNLISVSKTGSKTPVDDTLSFFSSFSNPAGNVYSWTRALPESIDYFASGDLALYFGLASDEALIRAKNPNLNFDVAELPQPKSAASKATFARVWSFSILSSSRNQNAALAAIATLTGAMAGKMAADGTGLVPARRDLLAAAPTDASQSVFYDSGLFASSWLDPDPAQTFGVFGNAVESIVAGQSSVPAAALNLSRLIDEILYKEQ
ncbi:MAG: ABC transporter substrate-binding protein [Patescibacteria group bacterium]